MFVMNRVKVKHIIVLFLIGVGVMTIGSLFRMQHWQGSGVMLMLATFTKTVAIALGIWKVLKLKKYKDLLDS